MATQTVWPDSNKNNVHRINFHMKPIENSLLFRFDENRKIRNCRSFFL